MPLQMSMTLESVSNPISDEKAYGPKLASELDSFSFPSGWAPAHAHLLGILFPLSSFDPLKLHNVEKKRNTMW